MSPVRKVKAEKCPPAAVKVDPATRARVNALVDDFLGGERDADHARWLRQLQKLARDIETLICAAQDPFACGSAATLSQAYKFTYDEYNALFCNLSVAGDATKAVAK